MKKTTFVLLMLFIVAVSGMVFVHNKVDALKDQVTIKETILAGDSSVAEGVSVTTNTHYEETPLFWETVYTIGDKDNPKTTMEYNLSKEDMYVWDDEPRLYWSHDEYIYWDKPGIEENPEDFGYPMELFADIIEATPPGEEKTGYIKYSDVIPYRTIHVTASFLEDGKDVDLNGNDNGTYFHIPMTENSDATVCVEKDEEGNVQFLSTESWHAYMLDEDVAYSKDLKHLYVALGDMKIAERDEIGQRLDFRSVPLEDGICGIHHFDATVRDGGMNMVDVDAVLEHGKLVYPLKNGISIAKLWVSEDQSQLLLLTLEEENMWFTALNRETFEEEQRMKLFTYDKNVCDGVVVKEGTDYLAVFFDDGHVVLMTRKNGLWNVGAVDKLYRGGTYNYSFSGEGFDKNFDAAFDGNRFVLVNRFINQAGSYFLWVYENGKCKYAGMYECSLSDAGLNGTLDGEGTDNPVTRYTYDNPIAVELAETIL